MSAEVWTILSVGTALGWLIIGLGVFLSLTIRTLRDRMMGHFDQVDIQFDRLERWFSPTACVPDDLRISRRRHAFPPDCGIPAKLGYSLLALTDDHNALAPSSPSFGERSAGALKLASATWRRHSGNDMSAVDDSLGGDRPRWAHVACCGHCEATWTAVRAVAECFREVRRQLAGLADDHNALARELSELRGEIRGRLDERARPASSD